MLRIPCNRIFHFLVIQKQIPLAPTKSSTSYVQYFLTIACPLDLLCSVLGYSDRIPFLSVIPSLTLTLFSSFSDIQLTLRIISFAWSKGTFNLEEFIDLLTLSFIGLTSSLRFFSSSFLILETLAVKSMACPCVSWVTHNSFIA